MSSLFAKKMQMKTYESHVKRLQGVTSAVDSSTPINKKPGTTKLVNRRRIREESINRENCNMLDRLAKIMQTKRIDNEGSQNIRERKSLGNNTSRKHQLQRITQENQRLLQRIQQINPIIDHVEFDIRAKKNEYLLRQMSDFKEVTVSPQIESWLQQKNKQLRGKGQTVVGSAERHGHSLRRSQSARTRTEGHPPSWDDVLTSGVGLDNHDTDKQNEEEGSQKRTQKGDQEGPDTSCIGTATKRRQRSTKPRMRKKAETARTSNDNSSPMRGRIRPKSGRI